MQDEIKYRATDGLIRITTGYEKENKSRLFFIDALYDSAWLCLWITHSYEQAIPYAEDVARDELAVVVDEVVI